MDVVRDIATGAFLVLGIGIELLCCIGLVAANDVFDRLHFLGPAASLGPLSIAAAIAMQRGFSLASSKAFIAALTMTATGPALTHALARAARVRQFEHWSALPDEVVE
jgi:multicomponent Na+:H+ antiporter subunit G